MAVQQRFFGSDFILRVKDAFRISDIIGKRIQLRKAGRNMQGLCPFHNEKTPSFSVMDDKGVYRCFGCGARGDVINFVMEYDHLDFYEAVELLAREAGISIPEITKIEDRERSKRKADSYEVLEEVCKYYQHSLTTPQASHARSYMNGRGVKSEEVIRFRIGYAPISGNLLLEHLQKSGFSLDIIVESGAIGKSEDGKLYDRFKGRLIFPIFDSKGRVVGFGGRILGEGNPKYLNSSESAIFRKSETLYAFNFARDECYKKSSVVVVEGYMDVISLHQCGFRNVVAPMGTAVTEQHLEILWKAADEPVFCLDGDLAGQKAMKRVAELALPSLKVGKSIRFAILPVGYDPDSFIAERGELAFEKFLGSSIPLAEMLWTWNSDKFQANNPPEVKAAAEGELYRLCDTIKLSHIAKYYKDFFKAKIWDATRTSGYAKNFKGSPNARGKDKTHSQISKPISVDEYNAVAMVMNFPELLDIPYAETVLANLELKDKDLQIIRDALLSGDKPKNYDSIKSAVAERYKNLPIPSNFEEASEAWRKIQDSLSKNITKSEIEASKSKIKQNLTEEEWEKFRLRYLSS